MYTDCKYLSSQLTIYSKDRADKFIVASHIRNFSEDGTIVWINKSRHLLINMLYIKIFCIPSCFL